MVYAKVAGYVIMALFFASPTETYFTNDLSIFANHIYLVVFVGYSLCFKFFGYHFCLLLGKVHGYFFLT